MIHDNPFVSAFIGLPEWRWKNKLRYVLAFHPWVPAFISDWSPVKGYERWYRLAEGDVVVDAGAYPGDYAIWAAHRVGPSGKVICFEPGDRNRALLERHVAAEGLSQIQIIPYGLWNEDAELGFDAHGVASTIIQGEAAEMIQVRRLDDLLADLGVEQVDVIKMDIEGAEIEALQGAEQTLHHNDAYVCIASYHVIDGATTSGRLEEHLHDLGYVACSEYPKHLTTYAWREGTNRPIALAHEE